jgi:hypothetical protein
MKKYLRFTYDWGSTLIWVYFGYEIFMRLWSDQAILAFASVFTSVSLIVGLVKDNLKRHQ